LKWVGTGAASRE